MLFDQPRQKDKAAKISVNDLDGEWIVRFQHKHYLPIAFGTALMLPAMVAHLFWGDFFGGLYVGGILRLFVQHHCTFCINSLAHWMGEKTYDDKLTPRDSAIVALITAGEGYHNLHV